MERIRAYLSVIFAIFRRDMLHLAKNPVALIIVLGLCILPALYSWYTIAAFWDPYQSTSSIHVAVANNDEGASTELTGPLNVGDEVVQSLQENHQLDWEVMDEDAALQSVYAGTSYAAIVLPRDFSASFASIFQGKFSRPQIEYYVNEKLTGSGVKIVDTGATDVEKQIDAQFVQTVSEKVLEMAQRAGLGMESEEAEAENRLSTSVAQAKRAMDDTYALLDNLPTEIASAHEALGSATSALSAVTDAIPDVDEKLRAASTQIEATRSSLGSAAAELGTKATNAATSVAQAASAGSQAAGSLAGQIRAASADAKAALAEAQRVGALSTDVINKLEPEAQANPNLASALTSLRQSASTLTSASQTLSQAASSLSSTADATANAANTMSDAADAGVRTITSLAKDAQATTVPQMQSSLDSANAAVGSMMGMTRAIGVAAEETSQAVDALSEAMEGSTASIEGAKEVIGSIRTTLTQTMTDLGALHTSTALANLENYLHLDPAKVSESLAAPVKIKTEAIYPVKNYGSGIAPFFTNLALWVAGFILMAMIKIKVDPTGLPKMTNTQAYFGRWLTYVTFGSAQGLITGAGCLIIGVQCLSPLAYLATCWLTALVYVNLMFGLAYSLRHVGKAISVVLLILQVPGSSGMFPIQMLPSVYQAVNPLLPFTYSINALREAIGGFYGTIYLDCMLTLGLIFLPMGFLVGLGLGHWCHNLNMMFDHELGKTNLYVAEQVSDTKTRFRIRSVLAALGNSEAYRKKILQRAQRFEGLYPRLARAGWVLLFAVPAIMLAIMIVVRGSVDLKIALVITFFCACVLIMGALLALNYACYDIKAQLQAAHSADDLASTLHKGITNTSDDEEMVASQNHTAEGDDPEDGPKLHEGGERP